ncbi:MAG: arginine--tRNA ligase [Candidatus Doudnabacteria bacterium RIFCSPHIGHO2_01_FULL_43_23]|uniref:Arginine--tRNA ligase n=1 Tax=Candidatus Doudnabacteria bacterium RIFCSPHIGHO2_01_FULL_43_23 TaxID=1817822 RepID=A0A1F5NVP7_9BACT|nr:MAG: arginine--tRNA ligase [Candidatus Doudnabacteria bacterium RIFCSPHIGHO2_01_FULL_43_23]
MKEVLVETIHKALSNLGYPSDTDLTVSYPPEKKFGDYSVSVAMSLGKSSQTPPRKIAQEIVNEIRKSKSAEAFEKIEIVGPGFINFHLSQKFLLENLLEILRKKNKYGAGAKKKQDKILIEYFQPNVAKHLHVGHLRTAVIGDSLYRILKFAGYKIASESHMGDWGTQFGLLLYAYKNWGKEQVVKKDPINELHKLYVEINKKIEEDQSYLEKGKAEFVKLEQGDPENRRLWQKFVKWSMNEFAKTYALIDIRKPDFNWPESFYEDKMPHVLEELKAKDLLEESEGAQIVDLTGKGLGVGLIVKSDRGTTYLLRDLATFIYRKSKGFTKQLYVVDSRQTHTLRQTFLILELMGKMTNPSEAVHVVYGFLSLPEGAMSTRKGTAIEPQELIDKANELAMEIIHKKNPKLKNKKKIARQVALGAIKYFDLSHNRYSDIIFEWDKVLNFEGNTGPYLQYTHARIQSILRKSKVKIPKTPAQDPSEKLPEELALMRDLNRFPEVVHEAAESYYPNRICDYLYTLAGDFNAFYQTVPVLKEHDKNKLQFRLSLIYSVAQVLKNGLSLLGIEAPEEM